MNKYEERFKRYYKFCDDIDNAYYAVIEKQDKNYEAMAVAEATGDDETLKSLNRRADKLTDEAEKLLHLRSDSRKVFDYIELMRDNGIEF